MYLVPLGAVPPPSGSPLGWLGAEMTLFLSGGERPCQWRGHERDSVGEREAGVCVCVFVCVCVCCVCVVCGVCVLCVWHVIWYVSVVCVVWVVCVGM